MSGTFNIRFFFVCYMFRYSFGFQFQYDIARPKIKTQLSLGFLDSVSEFWKSRQGDFVRLEETGVFGPGPCLILYHVPQTILDEEIQDMISDGAPSAFRKGIQVARIVSHSHNDNLLVMTVEEALTTIMADKNQILDSSPPYDPNTFGDGNSSMVLPILFFSGFENSEMISTFRILSQEIIREIGIAPACAKAVPNSMAKQLQKVLDEISGDHTDAIGS